MVMRFPVEMRGVRYRRGGRDILAGCDLDVAAGEAVAVTGRSGAGKSTLLWVLVGLLAADAGDVRIGGDSMTQASARRRAALRQQYVGVVFQQPELIPELSPLENAALPALLARRDPRRARQRAAGLLERLGIEASTRTPALSGGEQQRVAVARALVNEPAVLVADEPTGSLDEEATAVVVDVLKAVAVSAGCAVVVVTHDSRVAQLMDRSHELVAGRLDGLPRTSAAPVP